MPATSSPCLAFPRETGHALTSRRAEANGRRLAHLAVTTALTLALTPAIAVGQNDPAPAASAEVDFWSALGDGTTSLGNQRFVGAVPWRQNRQSFDALRIRGDASSGFEAAGLAAPARIFIAYHQFSSDEGSVDYGTELNANLIAPLSSRVKLGVRFADFSADDAFSDITKLMAWIHFRAF